MTQQVVCSERAMKHLARRDRRLAAVMERMGSLERRAYPDVFTALLRSVVSQQISKAAAASVWGKVTERFAPLTPETLGKASPEDLRACGLSLGKVRYFEDICHAALRGELEDSTFENLSDDEVVARLSALRGVGVWTAEMVLIFCLGRPDVVSWGDLAIRRGMTVLYGYETLTRDGTLMVAA